jgi:DNA-binding NarL/FixJ family response regulator
MPDPFDFYLIVACGVGWRGVVWQRRRQRLCAAVRRSSTSYYLISIWARAMAGSFSDWQRNRDSQGRVLMATAGVNPCIAAKLIRSGISGVFLKHDSAASLAQAIRDVMAGKVWLDQEHCNPPERRSRKPQDKRTRPFTEREPGCKFRPHRLEDGGGGGFGI